MNIAQYTKAASLDEAWELNQKRSAVILGGCCWLRLSPQRRIAQAIDLSALGLDQIEEDAEAFRLGAMVTLSQLEGSESLEAFTQGAMKEALRHIVGTQFRNMATLGGSISGRFGFSDVWTLFLALGAKVELYKGGLVSLAEFGKTGPGKDIVTHLIVPKKACQTAYASLRLNATDFPIIAVSASTDGENVRCAIGARPARAEVVTLPFADVQQLGAVAAAEKIAASMKYESNMRASEAYRRDMAEVLCRRVLTKILGGDAK